MAPVPVDQQHAEIVAPIAKKMHANADRRPVVVLAYQAADPAEPTNSQHSVRDGRSRTLLSARRGLPVLVGS